MQDFSCVEDEDLGSVVQNLKHKKTFPIDKPALRNVYFNSAKRLGGALDDSYDDARMDFSME